MEKYLNKIHGLEQVFFNLAKLEKNIFFEGDQQASVWFVEKLQIYLGRW